MGWMLVGWGHVLIRGRSAFTDRAWGGGQSMWDSHLLCVWVMSKQHNNLWGGNYVAQRWLGRQRGPPCFRQQVQLTIWQLTSTEGVIQTSRGRVDPAQAVGQPVPKPTNQQTSPDTGGEQKQHGGGGDGGDESDERRCLSSQELDGPADLLSSFCE